MSAMKTIAAVGASTKRPSEEEDIDYTKDILFITNRTLDLDEAGGPIKNKSILDVLTDQPADPESNLRFGRAWNVKRNKWRCDVFADQPTTEGPSEQARQAVQEIIRLRKPILLYVHGFNNNPAAPLQAAKIMQKKYECTVIPFLWPSDGNLFRYKRDRDDAKASAEAFLRFLMKIKGSMEEEEPSVAASLPKRQKTNDGTSTTGPPPKVTLLCHSMGNYLLENAVKGDHDNLDGKDLLGITAEKKESTKSFLQHILLTAADVDSQGHVEWVGRLKPKGKVFILINKGDQALIASNRLIWILNSGQDNPVRLGQTLEHIDPTFDRIYVDVIVRGGFVEHSYHADGEDDIKKFYRSIIQDEEQWQVDPSYLPRYYQVKGPSSDG